MFRTDNELIENIRAGDRGDFRVLVERYSADAITLAARMLGNRSDAEEVVQDAFVRAYKGLTGFRRDARFSTWFYRIVYNLCLTVRERRKTRSHLSLSTAVVTMEAVALQGDAALRPDRLLEHDELQRVVEEGINEIPVTYRDVFLLFFSQAMSYEEIAELMVLPLNTVKSRLFRARAMLREHVKAYLERSDTMDQSADPQEKR